MTMTRLMTRPTPTMHAGSFVQRATLTLWVALFALALAFPARSQGAPEQIFDALAEFNARIGANLTLNDFFWTWSQQTYSDTSLGCPVEGEVYAQATIIGYRFVFRWQDQDYDYRVSADRTIVRFCGVTPVSQEADDADEPDERLSNSLCVAPEGVERVYMRTRLAPEVEAVVLPGLPNRLREAPNTSAVIITEIPAGELFRVIAGPDCDAEGRLWWQVEYGTLRGWTTEGQNGDYFVTPRPPFGELPLNRSVITPANFGALREVARVQGNYSGGIGFSPAGNLIATTNAGSEGVWVYDPTAITREPRALPDATRMTRIAFTPAEGLRHIALLGADDGTIRLWNTSRDAQLIERAQLRGHRDPVTAVAFSADGTRVAAAGGLALTSALNADGVDENAIVIWNVDFVVQAAVLRGHTAPVTGLAFNPTDTNRLISVSANGELRLWDVASAQPIEVSMSEHPYTSVAISPDGAWVAAGYANGFVNFLRLSADATALALTLDNERRVNGVAFSPDSETVAIVTEDGVLTLLPMSGVDNASVISPTPQVYGISDAPALAVAFSPDGTLIAVLDGDNSLRLYAVDQG